MSDQVYVIAEAGVNHNGDIDRARKMIEVAEQSGADAVKFQTFDPERLVSSRAPKANYQLENTEESESQKEMLEDVTLSRNDFRELKDSARDRDIELLSSPFDVPSLQFLVDEINIGVIKIPSGEITNGPLLWKIGHTDKSVILSTGMSTIEEVDQALEVLSAGYTGDHPEDGENDGISREYVSSNVALLHCVSEYPAPVGEINLRAMDILRDRYDVPVGFSDHTLGQTVPIAAVGRGARIIEKHFTLDRSLSGPDHEASLEPDELAEMIDQIRTAERALGDGEKGPTPSERDNIPIVRKSLVASKPIREGEPFTEENLTAKRPGTGVSPMNYWGYLHTESEQDYREDELI